MTTIKLPFPKTSSVAEMAYRGIRDMEQTYLDEY